MKLAQLALEPQWFRVSGLTQYDTTNGFYPLRLLKQADGQQELPLHVWDLTAHPNYVNNAYLSPDVGFVATKFTTADTAEVRMLPIFVGSQNANGVTTQSNTVLRQENVFSPSGQPASCRKSFHHWSHIKLNLYGVRKRATRYVVQLVMVKQEFADFIDAAGTNLQKQKLIDYLVRPFIWSNLNQSDPQTLSMIKIVKTYEVIIDPITTDEYSGSSSVPHIQTVNWFVKHNRVRRYDWSRGAAASTDPGAIYDDESAAPGYLSTRVDPSNRLYLVLRALAPEQRIAAINPPAAVDPITEPSYDLVIRQKFSDPS